MWLEWEPAAMLVFILVGAVIALRPVATRWADVVGAFARELAIMFTLYAVWRLAAQLSLMQVDGAVWRGRWLWDVQRAVHLPSEVSVQHVVLPHPLLVQAANVYYAVAHVPAMILFLAWLFTFHRPRYPKIRNAMALTTGACLLIQLIPVAPPRLVPGLGIVDTPLLYHQSVYGRIGTGIASQLSAMPSVHVAWALLVGFGVVMVSSSRTRWLVLAHPIVTVLVVVATGNHFWLDGIVAAALLAMALFAQRWSPIEALRQSVRTATPADEAEAPAGAEPSDLAPDPVDRDLVGRRRARVLTGGTAGPAARLAAVAPSVSASTRLGTCRLTVIADGPIDQRTPA